METHSAHPPWNRGKLWFLGFLGAVFYSAAQATQFAPIVPRIPWLELFLFELPVWSGLVVISPAIFYVARRFPLVGPRAAVNFLAHLLPCTILLLAMFFLVETTRQFVIAPLVTHLGFATTREAMRYVSFTADVPLVRRALNAYGVYGALFSLVYFAVAFLYYGVVYNRDLLQAQVRERELHELLSRSQLVALKSQLQPHFLFNTLNTVSSLMGRDILLARRMLAKLGDLLRESLRDSSEHETSLRSELHFLDIYLEIQKARFGARLLVERHIDTAIHSALVPHMILQPLAENAIRHGMTDDDDGVLLITVIARTRGQLLDLIVRDNGRGDGTGTAGEGVGIRNTRERLRQLYGDESALTIARPAVGGFEVAIVIPLRISDEYDREDIRDTA
jgi:two-component system LytT family sensor kinase